MHSRPQSRPHVGNGHIILIFFAREEIDHRGIHQGEDMWYPQASGYIDSLWQAVRDLWKSSPFVKLAGNPSLVKPDGEVPKPPSIFRPIDLDFFNPREWRPLFQLLHQKRKGLLSSFRRHLYSPILKIHDIPCKTVSLGSSLGEKAKSHPLDRARNNQLQRCPA